MRIPTRFANKNLRFCRAVVNCFSISKPKFFIDQKRVVQPTILLTNVFSENNNISIDHIWILIPENILSYNFILGDIIAFTGKASYYNKHRGNRNESDLDMGLTDIRNIQYVYKNTEDPNASLSNFMRYCMNLDNVILPDVYQDFMNSADDVNPNLSNHDLKRIFGNIQETNEIPLT